MQNRFESDLGSYQHSNGRSAGSRAWLYAGIAAGAFMGATSVGQAALSVYEPFNYTVSGTVSGNSGGGSFGFSSGWTGGSASATISSGSLPGTSTIGNKATMTANSLATPLSRTLSSSLGASSGTTYISFLLRPEAAVGTSSAELRLFNGTSYAGFGLNSNSGAYLIDQNGTGQSASSSFATVNSPVLLVLKAVFVAGATADTFSLFYNPLASSTEGTANATRSFDIGTVTSLQIGGNLGFSIDEIKIGSTYADVVPEPSTYLAAGTVTLMVGGQWFIRRRRNAAKK